MIKALKKLEFTTLLAVFITAAPAYYLLLADGHACSIDSIIDFSQTLELPSHILVLGLLPIYISIILITAVISGIYLGRLLRSISARF